jgi:hypothetical protein
MYNDLYSAASAENPVVRFIADLKIPTNPHRRSDLSRDRVRCDRLVITSAVPPEL